jgi:ATP-dependent Lon protease
LTGRVLPIGGLKEKLIAARRSKVEVLIFPKENLRDYDELPAYLKKGLEVHFVDTYDEVYKIAFHKRAKTPLTETKHEHASVAPKKAGRAKAP